MIRGRLHWIFDLDGTLTVAQHDFDAIRRQLGIAAGRPILETLEELPAGRAAPLYAHLDRIERDLAGRARAAPGAAELLSALRARGARMGILTRNRRPTARRTLDACGLSGWFADEDILGREEAPPKPDPGGIERLLARWRGTAADAVMVGDNRMDIAAGRAAGAAAVCVGARNGGDAAGADLWVQRLDQLLPEL
ncbi:MAG: HAD family hydrolase [Proteobacteria bacterium]|nr:HAD family hydrolase [Pseudomonadota bacterium]